MHKIVVTTSAIIINDYNIGDCIKIENFFKIYDPVTHSYYYLGLYYDEKNKRLYLPRGIDIWFVESQLGERAYIPKDTFTPFRKFNDITIKLLPRDDKQKEALRFMLSKQEYQYTSTYTQLSVNLQTGKGKTYLTVASLAYLSIRGIVITESINWLKQWRKCIQEYTNITDKEIYNIEMSNGIHKIFNMSKQQLSKYKIFLVTHDTIQSFATNNGWEKIGELFEHLEIGVKIFDEAHLNFKNIYMIDFYTNVFKTYYLTATPAKSSESENRVYQMYFKNIPSIDLFDENVDPHTEYIAFQFNSKPTPMQISDCKNAYGLDRNKYTNYVVQQEEFYKLLRIILDICLKATKNPGEKFLMYIGTNASIEVVKVWIEENYPELRNDIGVYTSVVSVEEKQIALNKRLILSTTKSAGAAVDIKGLKVTVVLAEPFKSEVIAIQTLGRTRDDNTFYIDVVDRGFKYCQKYYYYKLPIFEKYATGCSIIKFTEKELEAKCQRILKDRNPVIVIQFPQAFIYNANTENVFVYGNDIQNAFSYN